MAADGLDGVSIRAVAKRIGGSTTLVTNYLPTREALLRNAIEHTMRDWDADLDQALEGTPAPGRLAVLARWACSTTGNDEVRRPARPDADHRTVTRSRAWTCGWTRTRPGSRR